MAVVCMHKELAITETGSRSLSSQSSPIAYSPVPCFQKQHLVRVAAFMTRQRMLTSSGGGRLEGFRKKGGPQMGRSRLSGFPMNQTQCQEALLAGELQGRFYSSPHLLSKRVHVHPFHRTNSHHLSPHLRKRHICLCQSDSETLDSVETGGSNESSFEVAIEKLGRNMRRIEASVDIRAPVFVVCGVLTDYGSLADIIPSLVVNEVLERRPRGARLLQVGEQDVAFGAKFSARILMDVEEVPAETLAAGTREIEFRQLEGDFQKFNGVWRMEEIRIGQVDSQSSGQEVGEEIEGTRLTYIVEVSPQRWMPVRLIEGRVSKEMEANLKSILQEAEKRSCQKPPEPFAALER